MSDLNNEKEMKNKENNKKNFKLLYIILIVIIIILIIIILLLLRNYKNFINKDILTGNIDIFEVDCNCNSTPTLDGLVVNDEVQIWEINNNLEIFKNPMYEMGEVIAPGSSNSYNFAISNKSDCEMSYKIEFKEENLHNVNMKYRIKRNNEYISEKWVNISEINLDNYIVNSLEKDNFVLEWKWIENNNDTAVGSINDSKYSLEIRIVGQKNI